MVTAGIDREKIVNVSKNIVPCGITDWRFVVIPLAVLKLSQCALVYIVVMLSVVIPELIQPFVWLSSATCHAVHHS